MSNSIYYKRIPGSTIQGNATSVTEPYGTLVITNNNDLRLHDGNTAGGLGVHTDSDWVNPNERTWKIRTYNGGAAVSFDGTTPVVWFDVANSPLGLDQFRGAIIDYHAFINNQGTIVGTIHIADDYQPGDAFTHIEHMSGGSNLQTVHLWGPDAGLNRGRLCFKRTDGAANTMMIQWTAKIFYGYEADC
jgi:hypothetical protein